MAPRTAPPVPGTPAAALGSLDPDDLPRAVELGVLAPDAAVPVDSVVRLWARTAAVPPSGARLLCARLVDLGLLVEAAPGEVVVPSDVAGELRSRLGDGPRRLHVAVVESHRDLVPVRDGASVWADLDVEYLWRHLHDHLRAAGWIREACALLDDPRWVLGRLDRIGTAGLRRDLQESPFPAHRDLAEGIPRDEVWPDLPDSVPVHAALDPPAEDEEAEQRVEAATVLRFEEMREDDPARSVPHLLALHDVVPDRSLLGPAEAPDARTARIRATTTPALRRALDGAPVEDLVVAPGGTWVAVADGREVQLRHPRTGVLLHVLHTPGVRPTVLGVAPDGSWLAAAGEEGDVAVWGPAWLDGPVRGPVRDRGRVVADGVAAPGADDRSVLAVRHHLADWQGPEGAVEAFTALAADLARLLGPDDPMTLSARHGRARWLWWTGEVRAAAAAHADLLADRERVLGPDHPRTLATRHDLACVHGDAGDAARAVAGLTAAVADHRRVLGPDHPATLAARANLAHRRRASGEDSADDPDGRSSDHPGHDHPGHDHLGLVHEDHVRVLGAGHPWTSALRRHLAHWLAERGRPDRAAAVQAQIVVRRTRRWTTDESVGAAQDHLARWCAEAGTPDAYPRLLRTTAAHRAVQGLTDEERERCQELVVFRGPVTAAALERFWARTAGWPAARSRDLRRRLVRRGDMTGTTRALRLVSRYRPPGGYYSPEHLARAVDLHRAAVDAHRDLVPVTGGVSRWSELDPAHDLWDSLPGHLIEAGLHDERVALFDDPRWFLGTLERRGPAVLAERLRESTDPAQHELAEVVRGAAHLLAPLDPPGSLAATLAAQLPPEQTGPGGSGERLLAGIDGPHLVRTGSAPSPSPSHAPAPARVLDDPAHEVGIEQVLAMVVAPDGSWLAAVDHEAVRVWDPATGRLLRSTDGGPYCGVAGDPFRPPACAVTPDGSTLVLAHDHQVDLVDPVTGAVRATLTDLESRGDGGCPAVAPDGSWLVLTGYEIVEVRDTATGELLAARDDHWVRADAVAVAPDGSWIASAPALAEGEDGDDGDGDEPPLTVRIWDPRTGRVHRSLPTDVGSVPALGVAPDGSWLLTVGEERVQLWDPATGALLSTVDGPGGWRGTAAVAPDGSGFAYAGADEGTVVVVGADGAVRHVLVADGVDAIGWTRDGRRVAAARDRAGDGERVLFWDAVTGEPLGRVPGGAPFAFAPDDAWIATSGDGSIGLWPLPPGVADPAPAGPPAAVTAPDGSWVAEAGADGSVLVREPGGAVRHEPAGHDGPVTALAASAAGGWLASGGRDGVVRVWDPVAGRALTSLRVGPPVTGLAADGDRLAVSAGGGTRGYALVGA